MTINVKDILFQMGIIISLAILLAIINNLVNPHRIPWIGHHKSGKEVAGVVDITTPVHHVWPDSNMARPDSGFVPADTTASVSLPVKPDSIKTSPAKPVPAPLSLPNFDPNDIKIYKINMADTYKLHQSGKALFIDARYPADFEKGHIKGAINLPTDMFDQYYSEIGSMLSIDDPILIYCSGPGCDLSAVLADILRGLGYYKLMLFEDGYPAWQKAGHPVE